MFVLVTEETLEENLLTTLSAKRELAMAALDPDSQVADVDVRTQADDIKEKLEVLLGSKPEAPVDETVKEIASRAASSNRLAEAGSSFLRAAFELVGEIAGGRDAGRHEAAVEELRATLDLKFVAEEDGKRRLSFAMPSREALSALVRGLGRLLVGERADDEPRTPAPTETSNGPRQGARSLN